MKHFLRVANQQTGVTDIPFVDIRGITDEDLDKNIVALSASHFDADKNLLALCLVERHQRACLGEAAAWLRDCETLYMLAKETYTASWICASCGWEYWTTAGDPAREDVPEGTPFDGLPADWACPSCAKPRTSFDPFAQAPLWRKYAPGPAWTFGDFAMDVLGLPPSTASGRVRDWEIYRVRYGWPVEVLAQVGRSKLAVARSEMDIALPQGGDEELATLLLGPSERGADAATWHEIWEYVREKKAARERAGGAIPSVTFKMERVVGQGGEDLGFALKCWHDDRIWQVATVEMNEDLPGEVREIMLHNLQRAFQRR